MSARSRACYDGNATNITFGIEVQKRVFVHIPALAHISGSELNAVTMVTGAMVSLNTPISLFIATI